MDTILYTEDFRFNSETELSNHILENLLKLWNSEYPMQLTHKSKKHFIAYLNNHDQKKHIIVTDHNNYIIGWFFKFEREGKLWFTTIVNQQYQGNKIGSTLLKLGRQEFGSLNGWVIDHDRYYKNNGEKYVSPIGFYLRNGCRVYQNDRLELPLLSAVKITL